MMIDKIKQSLYYVAKKDKTNLLIDLLVNPKMKSVLIFTRTKHGANKLVKELLAYGVKADAIHGNKSQNKRQQALQDFKTGKLRVLVATDIAARGIDIDELSHVVNYDLPEVPETYVHRIGRTGRAGLSGEAYSFCNQDENHLLIHVEKHIKMSIPVVEEHPFHVKMRLVTPPSAETIKKKTKSVLKNKTKKGNLQTLKKNFNEKQKKTYHDLVAEQEEQKDVFKRSKLPKKKVVVVKEEAETPKFGAKSFDNKKKGYQPRDLDRDEKSFKRYDKSPSDDKRPYTPRSANSQSSNRPYTPRENNSQSDRPKTYTPRENMGSSDRPKTYTPRENSSYSDRPKTYTPRPNSGSSDQQRSYKPRTNNDQNKSYTPNKK
jgi:ATP-dependent RNA helicase RhlE